LRMNSRACAWVIPVLALVESIITVIRYAS
jgi:hypothetical protein